VRATERLIGDVVMASRLSNSPKMVVQGVDIQAKQVTTVWFSDDHQGSGWGIPGQFIRQV
jgi:hypothetical protein